MWIQIILILAMLGIAFYLLRSRPGPRHLALRRLGVVLALLVGIIVVLAPGWLTLAANAVGIGRGADLLLYAAIVMFLLYVVAEYKKSVETNRNLSRLARALTLAEARLQDSMHPASTLRDGSSEVPHPPSR